MGASSGTGGAMGGGSNAMPSQGQAPGEEQSFSRLANQMGSTFGNMDRQSLAANQISIPPAVLGSGPSTSSGGLAAMFGGAPQGFRNLSASERSIFEDDFGGGRPGTASFGAQFMPRGPALGGMPGMDTYGGGYGGRFGYGNYPGMGPFGGRFSPVDQGPPQPFNINRATPIQYQAASYPQGNIANQLASGYQQVFGRAADPGGLDYWAQRLGGQNLSQGEVNRYLLGGAQNEDVAGGADYSMSLTGGRPSLYDTSKPILDSTGKPVMDSSGKPQYEYSRQYRQPIYSPTYQNYSVNRGFYSPGYGMTPPMSPINFMNQRINPFLYYAEGGDVSDDDMAEVGGIDTLLK
jgi:hypothetical protein